MKCLTLFETGKFLGEKKLTEHPVSYGTTLRRQIYRYIWGLKRKCVWGGTKYNIWIYTGQKLSKSGENGKSIVSMSATNHKHKTDEETFTKAQNNQIAKTK